jgi:hypothetical protein
MGTATMSSYARPTQTCHFYEIDEQIRLMSLPEEDGVPVQQRIQDLRRRLAEGKVAERERKEFESEISRLERLAYFGYVQDALKRGANIKVLMGDARLRMALPWVPQNMEGKDAKDIPFEARGGPEYFYHLMVVDAFSSDAIPRHLLTKESMEMYFRHLVQGRWVSVDPDAVRDPRFIYEGNKMWVPGGLLCVHTSNRHLRLVPVVTDTASVVEWDDLYDRDEKGQPKKKTGLVARRGHDSAPGIMYLGIKEDIGHSSSEWVIVARDANDLKQLEPPKKYDEWMRQAHEKRPREVPEHEEYWTWQTPTRRYIWTDDHSNLMAVFRWPWARHSD